MKSSLTSNRSTVSPTRVEVSETPGAEELATWDHLVDATPGSDAAQLSSWARFRSSYGNRPLYVFVYDRDTLIGGAQILQRRVPVVGTIGYVQHGPVCTTAAAGEAVATALAELGRRRFRMLFVQPPRWADETSHRLIELGFRTSSVEIAPPGSILLDLDQPEDVLRKGLTKKLARWVNKWPRAGVTVRPGDRSDVPLLAGLLARSAAHQGFDPLGESYVARLYDALAPSGHAAIFVGLVDDRPVAAALMTMCGSVVSGRLKGMDRSDNIRRLRVPAAVHWEIILWAKRAGYRWLDGGGLSETMLRALVDGEPGDRDTWPSADVYKLQFGGVSYRYPTPVELIRPGALRLGYDLSRRLPAGQALVHRIIERLRGGRLPASGRS